MIIIRGPPRRPPTFSRGKWTHLAWLFSANDRPKSQELARFSLLFFLGRRRGRGFEKWVPTTCTKMEERKIWIMQPQQLVLQIMCFNGRDVKGLMLCGARSFGRYLAGGVSGRTSSAEQLQFKRLALGFETSIFVVLSDYFLSSGWSTVQSCILWILLLAKPFKYCFREILILNDFYYGLQKQVN